MAIATAAKRMSAMNFGLPWYRVLPEVDGGIGQGDRLHLLGLYGGIAVSGVPTTLGLDWTLDANPIDWTLDSNPIDWTLDKE